MTSGHFSIEQLEAELAELREESRLKEKSKADQLKREKKLKKKNVTIMTSYLELAAKSQRNIEDDDKDCDEKSILVAYLQEEEMIYDLINQNIEIKEESEIINQTGGMSIYWFGISRLRSILCDVNFYISELIPKLEDEEVRNRLQNIYDVKNEEKDLVCGICHSGARFMTITSCGHIFCGLCIVNYIREKQWNGQVHHPCPICRGELQFWNLYLLEPNMNERLIRSPKADAMNRHIEDLPREESNQKALKAVLLTEQGEKILDFLEEQLTNFTDMGQEGAWGYKIFRLRATDDLTMRQKAVDEFKEWEPAEDDDGGPRTAILLCDFKKNSPYIDLSVAECIFFLEPWLDMAKYDRAIRNVIRADKQTKRFLFDLPVINSIDDKMLKEEFWIRPKATHWTKINIEEAMMLVTRPSKGLDVGPDVEDISPLTESYWASRGTADMSRYHLQ